MSKKYKISFLPIIRREKVPYKLPPEIITEKEIFSIIISFILAVISYVITFSIEFHPESVQDFIEKLGTVPFEKNLLIFLVSVLIFFITFFTRKAFDIRKIPAQIALISTGKIIESFGQQRKKTIEEGIKKSIDPASYVHNFANDAVEFKLSDINEVVKGLVEGDMMFTVNSLDMVGQEVLAGESVKEYLKTQKDIVKTKNVRIERQFRKLGGSNVKECYNSESNKNEIEQIVNIIKEHQEEGFNPSIEFYNSEVDRNPFLDYALVFHQGELRAFITYPIGNWLGKLKKIYHGVNTSDLEVIRCLLKDRFSRQLGYKTYEIFIKEYEAVKKDITEEPKK